MIKSCFLAVTYSLDSEALLKASCCSVHLALGRHLLVSSTNPLVYVCMYIATCVLLYSFVTCLCMHAGKCIASQVQATFFSISASSLTSKWVSRVTNCAAVHWVSTMIVLYCMYIDWWGWEDGASIVRCGSLLPASCCVHWWNRLTTLTEKWHWTRVIQENQNWIFSPTGQPMFVQCIYTTSLSTLQISFWDTLQTGLNWFRLETGL